MVVFLRTFEKRHLIKRSPHPTDGRAIGLSLTPEGMALMEEAEAAAAASDNDAVSQTHQSRAGYPAPVTDEDLPA